MLSRSPWPCSLRYSALGQQIEPDLEIVRLLITGPFLLKASPMHLAPFSRKVAMLFCEVA